MATAVSLAGPGPFWKLSLCWAGLPGSRRAPASLPLRRRISRGGGAHPVTAVPISGSLCRVVEDTPPLKAIPVKCQVSCFFSPL